MRTCPQCATSCDETHKFCPSCGFPIGKVATQSDDPLIGRTLQGGYVILELVGIGGMGRVYRAEQTTLGRTVAVKIIHPHLIGEENAAARFITEARAASRLNHPNSIAIIDFGKTNDGQLYLVMEYLRGKDLARVLYEEGPLSFRRVVDITRQVLAALAEAHHLNIIHRDLKPENIFLEPMRAGGDFVKVLDFGLAKMRAETQAPSITSPGIVCGTPEYMSPEQGRGDPLDARSDLYAVGVILYQLLTGRLPFEGETATQVVLAHISTPPTDPRKVAPDRKIPAPLVDICLKALSKDQKDRFKDSDEFAGELSEALAQIEERGPSGMRGGAATIRCLTCGTMNAIGQKFCGECGAPMQTLTNLTTLPERFAERTAERSAERGNDRSTHAPPPLAATEPPRAAPAVSDKVAVEKRRPTQLPFMGRDEDMAWLEERRSQATSALVGARIIGETGMGKTRLLRELVAKAQAAGDLVVETGPDPTWADVGYFALRRAVQGLAALPDGGGTARDWTGASAEAKRGLSDLFGKQASRGDAPGLSPDERRFAAAEALRWAIVRASDRAKDKRVLITVDDLQAIDGASRNAFADAVSEPPLSPSLLVAAYTPGFEPGWPGNTAAARVLVGLPTADVAELFVAGKQPSRPSLSASRAILPLYVEQLIRFMREQGGAAPTRLADLIALRVERLPADARRVLQAISVWGDDANDEVLMPLLKDEEPDLVDALGFLRRAGMIEVTETEFRTTHPLVRDVVLTTIPAAVKKELHQAAADVCEARGAPLEVRALHEYAAQNSFQALILLERVSSECIARGDLAGSILTLRRGLELARRELFRGELDDPDRAVLIFSRKLGEVLAKTGAYTDADGVLREALDIARPSGQDRAKVLGVLAHVAHGRDRHQEAQTYLREALDLATRSGSRELVTSLETLKRAIAS